MALVSNGKLLKAMVSNRETDVLISSLESAGLWHDDNPLKSYSYDFEDLASVKGYVIGYLEATGGDGDGEQLWIHMELPNRKSIGLLFTEDPEDGYRSSLKSVAIVDPKQVKWVPLPATDVMFVAEESSGSEVHIFMLQTRKLEWLFRVGTDFSDDYYPSCILLKNLDAVEGNEPAALAERDRLQALLDEAVAKERAESVKNPGWGTF